MTLFPTSLKLSDAGESLPERYLVQTRTGKRSGLKIKSAMKLGGFLSIAFLLGLSGCVANGKLYPVKGPLSLESPLPVFNAKITGGARIEHFYATISNGETVSCQLDWNSGNGRKSRMSDASANAGASPFNMGPAWDAVYGATFYEAHVLGTHNPYYWCTMTGSQGTVVHAEMVVGDGVGRPEGDSFKGVVQDGKGNIYKFVL